MALRVCRDHPFEALRMELDVVVRQEDPIQGLEASLGVDRPAEHESVRGYHDARVGPLVVDPTVDGLEEIPIRPVVEL